MDFELNNDEIKRIELLYEQLSRISPAITALGTDNYEHIQERLNSKDIALILREHGTIRSRARERSLKHFASRHQELLTALKGEINNNIVELGTLEKSTLFSRLADPKMWRMNITDSFSPYLAILNDNERSEILAYIDYAFTNREQIFSDAQKQDTSAVRTITRRSQELKLETTRVGRIIFEREEKTNFNNEDLYNRTADNMPEVFTGTHPQNRRREIFTFVSLKIETLKQALPAISRLEPFDGEVLSSCISLYADGNEYTTPDMIYRHMLGNKRVAKLNPKMREAILASLRKLRLTSIIIRAEQELEAGYSKKSRYEGVILPNEVIEDETVSLNGKNVRDCIHFFRNSPLYEYADDKNQISRIPVAMLDVPANNDKELIILKGYLARRYAEARNSNSKLGNIIRYDSIFAYMGIDSGNRKQTKRIRDTVKIILETWKKAGYITSYEEIKEGRTIAKIKIKLPRKKVN